MEKYGFIYIWYDAWRKMYYIGCHWGTENDGYVCSSNRMRDAYRRRPQDFTRRVIQNNISRESLLEEEYKWLSLIPSEQLGKKYYNLSKRHFGHWTNNRDTQTVRDKISSAIKELHKTPEYRKKFLDGRKNFPSPSKETIEKRAKLIRGIPRSEETKQKISKSSTGKSKGPLTEETKRKISKSLSGEKNPFYNKRHSVEKMKQISEKISTSMKGKRPGSIDSITGSFWWTNGTYNKRSKECPGNTWVRGKINVSKKETSIAN